MTTIEVKNDGLLGRTNDGVIAVKFYAMQKQIDDLQQENKQLKNKIKDTIKDLQENNNGDDYSLINVINILKSLLGGVNMSQNELEYKPIPNIINVDDINKILQENKQLKEEIEEYKRMEQEDLEAFNNYDSILTELEEWLKSIPDYFMDKRSFNNGVYIEQGMKKQIDLTLDKIQELKEKYK